MTDFEFFVDVFGCFETGVPDPSALVAEMGWATQKPMWDYRERQLDAFSLDGHHPPACFVGWWLCEHVRRGHAIPEGW